LGSSGAELDAGWVGGAAAAGAGGVSITEASFAEASALGTIGAVLKDAPEEEVGVALAGIVAEDFLSGVVVGEVVSGADGWENPGLALFAASPIVAASEAEVGACAPKLEVRFDAPRFEESRSDELKFDALKFEETEFEAPKFEIAKFEAARLDVRGAMLS
jgi:hypothetical protein